MSEFVKHYSNGEVTIVWKPDLCIHSANCFRNLPEVFNPRVKPWIKPDAAPTERLIAVVSACPSGALSIEQEAPETSPEPVAEPPVDGKASHSTEPALRIDVQRGGPYTVVGRVDVCLSDGSVVERTHVTTLCRCGLSKAKPFCDGSHVHSDLDR